MKRSAITPALLLLLPLTLWRVLAVGHAAAPPAPAQAAPVSPALSPGVMVCEPVGSRAACAGADFGAGCSYWLQMSVGGLPQLGQTPLWAAFARARTEMGRADMRLAPSQAAPLASILGVTHVAVGTVTGSTAHRTLTYRLRTVPSGIPVGQPLRITGTDAQIAAHLPEMARALALRLGVTSPNILSMTGTTAADLQELGRVRWLDFRDLPPS